MYKKIFLFFMIATIFLSCSGEKGAGLSIGDEQENSIQTPVVTLEEPESPRKSENQIDNSVNKEMSGQAEKVESDVSRFYDEEIYNGASIRKIPRLPAEYPGFIVSGEGAYLVFGNEFRLIQEAEENEPAIYGTIDHLPYRESENKSAIPVGTYLSLVGKLVYDTDRESEVRDAGSAYNLEYREESWGDKLLVDNEPGYFYLTEYQGVSAYIWEGDIVGQTFSESKIRELYYQVNRKEYSEEYFDWYNGRELTPAEINTLSGKTLFMENSDNGTESLLDLYQQLSRDKTNDLYVTTDLFYEVWMTGFNRFRNDFEQKVMQPLYKDLNQRILQVLGEMNTADRKLFPDEMTQSLESLRYYFLTAEVFLEQKRDSGQMSREEWSKILIEYPEPVRKDVNYILGFSNDNLSAIFRKRLPERSRLINNQDEISGLELCENWFSIPLSLELFPDSFGREVLFLMYIAETDFEFRESWDKAARAYSFFNGCIPDRLYYTEIVKNSVDLVPDFIFKPGKRIPVLEKLIASERYKNNGGFYFLGNKQIALELKEDPLSVAAALGVRQAEAICESDFMAYPEREEKLRHFIKLIPDNEESMNNLLDFQLKLLKASGDFIEGNQGIFNKLPAWRSRGLYSGMTYLADNGGEIVETELFNKSEDQTDSLAKEIKYSEEEERLINQPVHYIEPNSVFFYRLEQFSQEILSLLQSYDSDFSEEELFFYQWNSILAFVREIITKQENGIPVTDEQLEQIAELPDHLAEWLDLKENQKLKTQTPPVKMLLLLDDPQGGKRVAGGGISGYQEKNRTFSGPGEYFLWRGKQLYK